MVISEMTMIEMKTAHCTDSRCPTCGGKEMWVLPFSAELLCAGCDSKLTRDDLIYDHNTLDHHFK